jgi:hypothetical protein
MQKLEITDLKRQSEHLFTKQYPMLSLYQTLADHFYPERADFTVTRNIGSELADLLVDSYPLLARRDLGNSFHAMLRDGEWFYLTTDTATDHMAKMWLQWATTKLKALIDDRSANFVRATKEGDHDFATFGQCVISIEMNKQATGLLFRCWHLRDMSWFEDETGAVGGASRKWKPTFRDLFEYFGDKNHPNIEQKLKDHPFETTDIRHLVLPSHMYGDEKIKNPYVSIWIDMANDHLIEAVGINHQYYVIPRFQTVSGSPYAYSPATVIALPDARALQAMTHTLLEAGERYARPPMIATQKVIRSDVDLAPDGITWVDDEYDERLGASLRTIPQDRGGFPIGLEMRNDIKGVMASAFYLNKLSLPDVGTNMTAYEVAERMKQYRRENLPLFAPIESEYNGQLCEIAFEIAMQAGLLGSPYDIPDSLKGRDVVFKFKSPLSESEEEKKVQQFSQVSQMLGQAAAIDPSSSDNVDFDIALRDAITGSGSPVTWLRSMEDIMQGRQAQAAAQAMQLKAEANAEAEAAQPQQGQPVG